MLPSCLAGLRHLAFDDTLPEHCALLSCGIQFRRKCRHASTVIVATPGAGELVTVLQDARRRKTIGLKLQRCREECDQSTEIWLVSAAIMSHTLVVPLQCSVVNKPMCFTTLTNLTSSENSSRSWPLPTATASGRTPPQTEAARLRLMP